jgi:hypothetical protein
MKTEPRYYVHTVTSIARSIRTPHWVVDRTTNLPVDEFASKKAAQDEADYLNDEDPRPAPATDANGNDIWGLWASLPGRHDKEVTVTTDSAVNRSAIGNFLLDEGFTVYAD